MNLATTIPSLPPVPLLERPLESPWLLAGVLALFGIASFWVLNLRGRAVRGLAVGGVLLGLAAVVVAVSLLVVTDREVLRARSAALTDAVAAADAGEARRILHPTVTLYSREARDGWGLDRILSFIEGRMRGGYAVRDHRIRAIEATLDGPAVGRTHVHVTVEPEATRVPTLVVVRLDWQRVDGQWRVVRIEPLVAAGVDVSAD